MKITDDLAATGSSTIENKLRAQESKKLIAGRRSWVNGKSPNFGFWAGNFGTKGVYAHEVGLVLGLDDRYKETEYHPILDFKGESEKVGLKEGDAYSYPLPGWQRNIMGDYLKFVQARNVEEIIGNLSTGNFRGVLVRPVLLGGSNNQLKLNNPLHPN